MKAFPAQGNFTQEHNGIDLRDYFAAKAMQALISYGEDFLSKRADEYEKDVWWQYVSEISYVLADEMIWRKKQ